ncbi:hypothetical protein DX980_18330 [Burkholderia gladioli]|nr:hypothetical protein DX980_18330 [Burkholderia gladioli]
MLTDEQILALNAGEIHFSESPSKYPEFGHGTQYQAGAPGVLSFARAVERAALLTSPRAGLPIVGYLIDSPDEPDIGHWFSEEPDTIHRCRALGLIDADPAAPVSAPVAEPASQGVIAAALAVIECDRAQVLTDAHIDALDNAIKIQRGEAELPVAAQAVAADGAIPTPEDVQSWAVTVEFNGMTILTISDSHVGGTDSIGDFGDVVRNCAQHLISFVGKDDAQRAAVSPATADRICTLIPLSELHPVTDEHPRVIVFTDGSDFNGAQFFDVSADTLNECFYESPDDQPEVCRHATHWMPRPSLRHAAPATADERAAIVEQCAKIADSFGCGSCGMDGKVGAAIRASQAAAPAEAREPHSDDIAVDAFAAAMKAKMAAARDKGRSGWETCAPADLSRMLREHVEKGDPRDVANFCMMLYHHGAPISAPADAGEAVARAYPDALTEDLRHVLGFPNFRCGPYAHLMRAAGADIQRKAEDEQAHVLHWLVKLVIDHGERWADVAQEELDAMREKVAGHQGAQGGKGGEA